ncbi:MAG TPA: bifunctional 5,10-methylenetetrahydrofolate dehydrogenase/5,10-methenyltetrahydrofolate cyclohydrolase [Bacilli bacterium]|jgi:methylenetetrahydrofolate dehydrogenase (NADP+)/methenyltetrahydrofolate cyclohydrolase|nr:bifunctional 5,10-methylenetetrahydrofolate dehydrogenase/5,10-methenyltetrahydrofolate cyclohydrolase [Acholeplasmataceae bacterium]HNZ77342.1 bifunctional 5,10-methylenetetrahydrofolate dehydrogenase/5,10-methenyltetrahydrofolate cyclohydrolase [Bacilli bacterium]HOD60685.1 bifunctional 5,10-methylenetetrahydrofolate dehydrogenase/5,10-methenyltetrahydrofolate cyclohydrolase [Bacilli bacterium]HOH60922.1 bifunctional 5,10-methylenetetrahydrofolate dehydrogenase/5,10-methenyltetrahydrofolate
MILDGKKTADMITMRIAKEVADIEDKITLSIFLVGQDPASIVYVNKKLKACDDAGILVDSHFLNDNITQKELIKLVEDCNKNPDIHGILVQMPLPSHIDADVILNTIDPNKDVDGLTIINQGKLLAGEETIVPATPKGVISILKKNYIDIPGKNVVVVGRSRLVGKPLALLFLQNNATVTIAHSKTTNLKEVTKRADILAVAVGIPNFITADMVKKDAVVIDIGINKIEGKLIGDVKYAEVSEVASYITPVPKGIGPMTIASLLENVLICYQIQKKLLDK